MFWSVVTLERAASIVGSCIVPCMPSRPTPSVRPVFGVAAGPPLRACAVRPEPATGIGCGGANPAVPATNERDNVTLLPSI